MALCRDDGWVWVGGWASGKGGGEGNGHFVFTFLYAHRTVTKSNRTMTGQKLPTLQFKNAVTALQRKFLSHRRGNWIELYSAQRERVTKQLKTRERRNVSTHSRSARLKRVYGELATLAARKKVKRSWARGSSGKELTGHGFLPVRVKKKNNCWFCLGGDQCWLLYAAPVGPWGKDQLLVLGQQHSALQNIKSTVGFPRLLLVQNKANHSPSPRLSETPWVKKGEATILLAQEHEPTKWSGFASHNENDVLFSCLVLWRAAPSRQNKTSQKLWRSLLLNLVKQQCGLRQITTGMFLSCSFFSPLYKIVLKLL